MPITIKGVTDTRVGYMRPALGGLNVNLDGTHVPPRNVDGSITVNLSPLNASLRGTFTQSAFFDGNIDANLGGLNVSIRGGFSFTDNPPVIISTPNPVFVEGTSATYDMSQHWTDDTISTVTSFLTPSGLGAGVSYDGNTHILSYDGVGAESTTTHTLTAQDAVGSATTASFNIEVRDLSAFDEDWLARSTGAGVLAAHNFEADNELYYFTRLGGQTNPNRSNLPNPLTLVPTPFGNSRAIRTRAVGTLIASNVVSAPKGASQVIDVGDASIFPDPSGIGSYSIALGYDTPGDGLTTYGVFEICTLTARNISGNTITVTRTTDNNDLGVVDGTAYGPSDPNTPSFPANGKYRVGYTNSGSWNRPLCSFPAGQNGKATDDIGITNGAAAKTRTWDATQGGTGHEYFREGYWGHRWYWDTAVNPSAPYKDWTPTHGGDGQDFPRPDAFEGQKLYIQYRFKVSATRIQTGNRESKLYFFQNAATSGPGQLFGKVGEQQYNEQPDPSEAVGGETYGGILRHETGGGDSRQPAGSKLGSDIQFDGWNFPPSGNGLWQTDYPNGYWNNRNASDCYAFCHQSNQYITMMIEVDFGRDNAEAFHPSGRTYVGFPTPYAGESDPEFQTKVRVDVAYDGDTQWTNLVDKSDAIWFFGDGLGDLGNLFYNAPGLNTFWMTQDFNIYFGSGSICPPLGYADIEYTQFIVSRSPVPLPGEVPSYVTEMSANEIKALTTVTNGNDTYFNCLTNEGSPWVPTVPVNNGSNIYTTHVQKADSFSGGIGNPAERICYMHGGGHAASAYNGVIGFDFKGDTEPEGFFLVPGSESPVPSGQDFPPSDGWPNSIHSYDEIGFDRVNRRLVRFGGSNFSANNGGGPPAPNHWYIPVDGGGGNPWVNFGSTFGNLANIKTDVDPVTNKLFYVNANLGTYFLDFADYQFSSVKTACPQTRPHQTGVFAPDAPGSSSGTFYVVGDSQNWKADIDFAAETVSAWSSFSPTGDTGFLSDQMLAMFWDERLEVIWIFGGRNEAGANGTLNNFYRYDPVTNVSTLQTMSGTPPVMDNPTDGNTYGLNKRFVYIPEWRAVGIITVYNQPAYIWRLPSS